MAWSNEKMNERIVANSQQASDQRLIQQAKEGDQQAFRLLVERYEQKVAATVIGMLGPGEEAEDVGQEVFVRFYKSMAKFRGDAALGTYLTRIAINLSLNAIKKRQRGRIFGFFRSDEGEALAVEDPDDAASQRDTAEWVQLALQRLEPQFRAVLVLRLMEGYSTRETAKMLGIPTGTVLSRLARAQKKFKKLLPPSILEK